MIIETEKDNWILYRYEHRCKVCPNHFTCMQLEGQVRCTDAFNIQYLLNREKEQIKQALDRCN